jgi:predicted nuclease with TOPRIM domain
VIVSQSRRRAAGGGGRNPFDNFEHVGISNLNATVRLLRFCKDNESMVDIEDLILENLRHVRTAVDGLRDDMREVKIRLGHLEEQVGSLYAQYASLSRRIDRLDERMEKVERQLELVE